MSKESFSHLRGYVVKNEETQVSTITAPDPVDHDRRRFVGTAAMTIAAAQLGIVSGAAAQVGKTKVPLIKMGTHMQGHCRDPLLVRKRKGSSYLHSSGKDYLMFYILAYLSALAVFAAIDAVWLITMGPILYRPVLGDILAPSVRIAPAMAFYAIYPIGILAFVVIPALRTESFTHALIFGLLFGAIAYATYDLTNYATLRNWTLPITLIDVAYGAIATGTAACASYLLMRAASSWFGGQPT